MDIRNTFFTYRSYTPIPLILAALIFAQPTWATFFAGLILILLGEGTRFWGVSYAGSATRATGTAGGGELVTSGPFALVRNPLYIGNFFIGLGIMIMYWAWMPWMALLYFLLFGVQYSLIIQLEEEYLSNQFNTTYTAYCSRVRRWIPRLYKYSDSADKKPQYFNALKSERNTLQAIAVFCALILLRWHLL
jgi:protein-S-isoprenylcysteine O-methyltransferase Ste14